MANYGYDKNTDYQQLINRDLEAQDYRSAAIHEAQRNEKIRGEGAAEYQTTSHYADYLPKTDQIDAGLQNLQNRTFNYNYQTDPAWQDYRKQYLREADRQTRDTMAAYAGQTLGVPSTAAVSAAQQAGNYQRSKLTDKIPELYQNAYSRYLDQANLDRQNLSLLSSVDQQRAQDSLALQQWQLQRQQAEDSRQQQIYQNAMNRWAMLGLADEQVASVLGVPVGTSTSDYSYTQWQQAMSEQQQAQSQAYQNWQMERADQEWQNTLEQQRLQQAQNDKSYALQLATMLLQAGKLPNDTLLAAAGIDKTSAQQLQAYYAAQIAAGASGGGGRSGGGSGRSRYSSSKTTKQEEDTPKQTPKSEILAKISSFGQNVIGHYDAGDYYVGAGESLAAYLLRVYADRPAQFEQDAPWIEQYYGIKLS
jgi:hypothetical protein